MAGKRSSVYGVGINDANYLVEPIINGKKHVCPAYMTWKSMLCRCYSGKYQKGKPTYIGVSVCDEWLSFMNFRDWWVDNHIDGWHLDKDLLTDNKEYSANNCIYIPSWLNAFTIDSGASRGENPIGVSFSKSNNQFMSRCCNPISGKREYLGYFKSADDAYNAWRSRKLDIALRLKSQMDSIDTRIYHRVVDIITKSK